MSFQKRSVLKAYFMKGIKFSAFLSNQNFLTIRPNFWSASSLFSSSNQSSDSKPQTSYRSIQQLPYPNLTKPTSFLGYSPIPIAAKITSRIHFLSYIKEHEKKNPNFVWISVIFLDSVCFNMWF